MPAQLLFPTPARKALITASVMGTTLVVAIDMTITIVAVPQMQASLAASPESIVWVLTSYLIASAIMMPLASWLASRFGRKRVVILSMLGFTLASVGCGIARGLEFMVAMRLIQGICGAGLIPLGQATLLDINPPEKQPTAMAYAGLGAMLGPLIGPTLGGWLTDNYSWRWVFLINVPIGIMATIAVVASHYEIKDKAIGKFDWMGFGTLTLFIGAFQLMMDRGQAKDWFDSAEVIVEFALTALGLFLTLVHMLTRRDTFVRAALFKDRNFALGCLVGMVIGMVVFASSPILTTMAQGLLGYTPFKFGLVNMPRAIGTIIGLLVVTRLLTRIDARLLLLAGLGFSIASLYLFSQLSLATDEGPIIIAGAIQGLSGGMLISPLSALAFSTLQPQFRNEAAAMFSLTRNVGNALGISVIQMVAVRATAQVTARLSEGLRPDDPMLQMARPDLDFDSAASLARLSREVGRQATMVAVVDTFWMGCLLAAATIPVVLMMSKVKLGQAAPVPADLGH